MKQAGHTEPLQPSVRVGTDEAGVGFRFPVALALVLAEIGVLVCLMTPASLTLALRIAAVFPETKSSALSVVLSAGALFAVIAGPLFGTLSDRTTSRFGRRRPYLVAGLLGGPIGLLMMGLGTQLAVIVVGWCVVQLMLNASKTVILTGVHDFIPPSHRGRVSAFMGMSVTIAPMIGTWLVQLVPNSALWTFFLPYVPAVVFVLYLLVVIPDRPAEVSDDRPRLTPLGFLRSLWINPVRYPDFGWATLNRFMVNIGFATFMGYQTYTLIDSLGLPREEAAGTVALSTTIIAVSVLVSAAPAGWISDKFGRRKIFVAGAGAVMSLGLVMVGLAGSITAFLVAACVTGIGYGLYQAIDLALVTGTLPTKDTAATGMGFSTAMGVVPQSLAPAIAPAVLAIGGGQNYMLLFVVAAVATILGCLTIVPIRSVR